MIAAFAVFLLDQFIKQVILEGFRLEGECVSLILVYNKGVAFSMLAFLNEYLKYLQICLLLGIMIYSYMDREMFGSYYIPLGILVGAGFGNVIDRFLHEGVVDYVYWHCGFDFAVFNFADVMIDIAIALILYIHFFSEKRTKTAHNDA